MKWDVFISHAAEDKVRVAGPLAKALRSNGLRVWLDEAEIQLGDSLRQKIDDGLSSSRFGIVVLSHSFFAKSWPQFELDGLVSRERLGRKVLLPIWVNLSSSEVSKYSPILAGRLGIRFEEGLESCVNAVIAVVRREGMAQLAVSMGEHERESKPENAADRHFFAVAAQNAVKIYLSEWEREVRAASKEFVSQLRKHGKDPEVFMSGDEATHLLYFSLFASADRLSSELPDRLRVATMVGLQPGLSPDREAEFKKILMPEWPDFKAGENDRDWFRRVSEGVLWGAVAGTAIPGLGNLAGAFVGGVAGLIAGGFLANRERLNKITDKYLRELERTIQVLQSREAAMVRFVISNAMSDSGNIS